ncbi:MAG: molybdopterin-dependent oxidoreductase [Polyangiaceae bacterium]
MSRRHLATCLLCEAACGILVDEDAGKVIGVRGDPDDPMSRGYVCPKVVGMQDLHDDPDRLRRPMVRDGGSLREATWEEALTRAAQGIRDVRKRHGNDAVAVYQGNPTAHNLGLMTFGQAVLRSLGTRNLFSASSTDQIPHMLASHEMFGHVFHMPIPDVDRTMFFLIIGANPLVSNGSIMTAPDMRRRIQAIKDRGGKVVVVDPRRTETAEAASEHLFIRPGADAAFVLAMIHTLFDENLVRVDDSRGFFRGVDELRRAASELSPERVETAIGLPASKIRELARAFATSSRAAAYGRVGTCHQEHGTLASWAIYSLAAITGNLDREGGTMWATPAADVAFIADRIGLRGHSSYRSRVRGLREVAGELPVAVLAEEIETPGQGQIRALITSAGNPVLSAPNGRRIEKALASLDHVVCIDGFLNETTRHAHVILPPVSPLQRAHFDLALNAFSVRNGAKYVAPPMARAGDERHDWEIALELGLRIHLGDSAVMARVIDSLASLGERLGPELIVDLALRIGPYKTTLEEVKKHPHGRNLGPLVPRLPGLLKTADRKVNLAPQMFVGEIPALRRWVEEKATPVEGKLVLIGRRHLRSNNSWLHNSYRLVKGPRRFTLLIHPTDAARLGIANDDLVEVESTRGTMSIHAEISDEIMPGVVSAPHGWGHHREGAKLSVAREHAGQSVNDITDETVLDRLSGNAAYSGVHVVGARARDKRCGSDQASRGGCQSRRRNERVTTGHRAFETLRRSWLWQ